MNCKLVGFRTNKLWKKIIACIYYLFCIIMLIVAIRDVPEIKANIYDMFIYKTTMILNALSFSIPILFISNFNIKDNLPLLKRKKIWSDILGFIIIAFLVLCCGKLINMCHSNNYWERIDALSETEIIYKEKNPDIIPIEDESTLPEDEIKDEIENLIKEDTTNQENNFQDNDGIAPSNPPVDNANQVISNNMLKIHYIDVGQGDSIFIELPNGMVMLIDAGESSKGIIVSNYIKKLGYKKIDYVIGTHPHSDHIGGLAYILNNFTIGNVYMPKAISTSKTYENLLNTISQSGLKVTNAKAGITIINNDNLKIDIIAPNSESYNNLNNYSAVIRMNYGTRKFLFMGDAETKSENEIMSDVSADVIKIGHHGSDTSSGQSFVNKVNAKYVIIMVGNSNRYDHPYQNIIDRWTTSGAKVYRTDFNGNIIALSDGNSLEINSSR